MKQKQNAYRVLSLDGGGMRGLYSATVLDTLAQRFASGKVYSNLDIGKGFDLIVGQRASPEGLWVSLHNGTENKQLTIKKR